MFKRPKLPTTAQPMSAFIMMNGNGQTRRNVSDPPATVVITSEQPTLRLDIDLRLAYFQWLEFRVYYCININPQKIDKRTDQRNGDDDITKIPLYDAL